MSAACFLALRLGEQTHQDGYRQVEQNSPPGTINCQRVVAPGKSEIESEGDDHRNNTADQTGDHSLTGEELPVTDRNQGRIHHEPVRGRKTTEHHDGPRYNGGEYQGRTDHDKYGNSSPLGLWVSLMSFLMIPFDDIAGQHTTGGGHIGRTGGLHGRQGTNSQQAHGKRRRVLHQVDQIGHQVGLFAHHRLACQAVGWFRLLQPGIKASTQPPMACMVVKINRANPIPRVEAHTCCSGKGLGFLLAKAHMENAGEA